MKTWRRSRVRLSVEVLESRTVLSSLTGAQVPVVPSLFDSAAQVSRSVATSSSNWSGYAAETNLASPASNAVSAVSGSWIVPAVTGKGTAYSAVWVGIDGYSSSTVEQIGTDSDIVNGKATYYAWYEMYPNASIDIVSLTVNPGDTISASVTYVASTKSFDLSITDVTTGKSYSPEPQTVSGALRSSAEWVVEAPSSNFGVLPLADFGTAKFLSASATIEGVSGPVDDFANAAINMVSSYTEDSTSALKDTTTAPITSSFTVTYDAPPTLTGGGHGHPLGRYGFGWFEVNIAAFPGAAAMNSANNHGATFAGTIENDGVESQNQALITASPRASASSAEAGLLPVVSSILPTDGSQAKVSAGENQFGETQLSIISFSAAPVGLELSEPSLLADSDLGFLSTDNPVFSDSRQGDSQNAGTPESPGADTATNFGFSPAVGAGLAAGLMAAYCLSSFEDRAKKSNYPRRISCLF